MSASIEAHEELAPENVAELLRAGRTQLVDVREPYEHEAGRIAGAVHIELERLAVEAGAIDAGRPVVLYCRVGARAALATQALRSSGFQAYNLAGGISAWVEHGLPIEPEGGRVAPH